MTWQVWLVAVIVGALVLVVPGRVLRRSSHRCRICGKRGPQMWSRRTGHICLDCFEQEKKEGRL